MIVAGALMLVVEICLLKHSGFTFSTVPCMSVTSWLLDKCCIFENCSLLLDETRETTLAEDNGKIQNFGVKKFGVAQRVAGKFFSSGLWDCLVDIIMCNFCYNLIRFGRLSALILKRFRQSTMDLWNDTLPSHPFSGSSIWFGAQQQSFHSWGIVIRFFDVLTDIF